MSNGRDEFFLEDPLFAAHNAFRFSLKFDRKRAVGID